jgi:hypothetical protein
VVLKEFRYLEGLRKATDESIRIVCLQARFGLSEYQTVLVTMFDVQLVFTIISPPDFLDHLNSLFDVAK